MKISRLYDDGYGQHRDLPARVEQRKITRNSAQTVANESSHIKRASAYSVSKESYWSGTGGAAKQSPRQFALLKIRVQPTS